MFLSPTLNDDYALSTFDGQVVLQNAEGTVVANDTTAETRNTVRNAAFAFAFDFVGTGAANTLTGDTDANKLIGLASNDTLNGGAGDDLRGDAFAKRLIGGDGDDFIVTGSTDDVLLGGNGDDYLDGRRGSDRDLRERRNTRCRRPLLVTERPALHTDQ